MMWLYVMFDLPVGTKAERSRATKFREHLLDEGFEMAQFPVYLRHCDSKESAEVHVERVRLALPRSGKVQMLMITDKQFANAKIFTGTKREHASGNPSQLALF